MARLEQFFSEEPVAFRRPLGGGAIPLTHALDNR